LTTPEPNSVPRRRRRRRLRAVVLAYLVLFFLIVFTGCADRLILFPSRQPIPWPGISRLEIPATEKTKSIEIWTARSHAVAQGAEPEAYCLEFTGNASRGEEMAYASAGEWGDHPVEIWAVNYPGYGGSAGGASLKSIPPAALAAYDALAKKAGRKPIFVLGQSLGTTAALHVAANRPVAGMVLANPPPLRKLILQRHGWWNLWLLATPVAMSVPPELDSLKNGPRVSAPAVFVLAGHDTVVPPKYQEQVFAAYAGPKRAVRVPTIDHNEPLPQKDLETLAVAREELWRRTFGTSSSDAVAPPASRESTTK
jgi:pimeloyl-ACP methyl ester carboxylesterase